MIAEFRQRYNSRKGWVKKIIQKLAQRNDELDDAFHTAHDEAFERMDCLTCANCCKTTSPIFYEQDIQRAANALRLKTTQFYSQYLRKDEDGDHVLQQAPCPFLHADNRCSIYDARPKACREYPHTNRKNMHQLLTLTEKNAGVCPAVFSMLEAIQKRMKISI